MSAQRRRLWPAGLITFLALGAWAWIWLSPADSRQDQVMMSLMVLVIFVTLLVLWLATAAGLGRWPRLAVIVSFVGTVVLLATGVELREVSGDVVPRLGFKWTHRPDQRLTTDLPARAPAREASTPAAGGDFPQFLGPHRNATVPGVTLARDWQASPPERLWQRTIGAGNSGFAVAGGIAVTQEQRGEQEMVVAYDLATGAPRWAWSVATRHSNPLSGDGPCATPTIAGGTVYALGATGWLTAVDLATGTERWSLDVLADTGAPKPIYGLCGSPLIDGERVIVVAGGGADRGLAAYRRDDGTRSFLAGDYHAAYASPMIAELAGERQIVAFHGGGPAGDITGHAMDGRPLWHASFPAVERTSQPVALPGGRLLISSGYGVGAKVFSIRRSGDGFRADEVWASTAMKAKLTQVVHQEGYLYGLDDGILAAVDAATGERAWKRGRYGHGQVLLVGDLLLVLSEKGEVALVEPVPEAFRELGRFQAIEGRTWNTPALAGPYLVVRNAREAACYTLPTVP